ncbi:MAG: ABC transporter ATP-binding protein [Alphaproteobacteria bacterium]
MTGTALVRVDQVGKTYTSGVTALSALTFSLNVGEIVAVVGPSGCGKSTLLRLIAGLETPTTGNIRLGYQDDGAGIGYIFQDPTLLPWATVEENITLPLRLGSDPSHATLSVDQALALIGLEDFARAYPRQLSGGMKMRVALARSLVTNPQLLLLDEPFAAIDEIGRFQLDEQLISLWQQRKFSAVFVTHSIYEAVYLAHRVVVMSPRPGRILGEVNIETLQPRSFAFRASVDYVQACNLVMKILTSKAEEEDQRLRGKES